MNPYFHVLTVSQLNFYVRSLLEGDAKLNSVFLRGEISNFVNHYRSGHFYLSLKDENSAIKAVMFKGSAQKLVFMPQNGMKVIVMGRASLYERDGQYQFYIDDMQPDGVGALHLAFEQLKRKLEGEGLFSPELKRPLPLYPGRIGVITSANGAALQDIRNILKRRWPYAQILLSPVLVQGDGAPEQICRAISCFNERNSADVLIVGRGGGSIEELWQFNDERVARAIVSSNIPVVSAVGHETDYTIADFAADLRAPTPSAAAELVSPDIRDVKRDINRLKNLMDSAFTRKIENCTQQLDSLVLSKAMKQPEALLTSRTAELGALKTAINTAAARVIGSKQERFSAVVSRLDTLSPLKVLARGYCIATSGGTAVTKASGLKKGQQIRLKFTDGEADCRVTGEGSGE